MRDLDSILTKKEYGRRPWRVNNTVSESLDYSAPKWMAIVTIVLIALSAVGECKTINVILEGKPKAVTILVVLIAFIKLLLKGDLQKFKHIGKPSLMYVLYWGAVAVWSLVIWVVNFTDTEAMTRGAEKIIFQTVAIVVAITVVYLFGARSIDYFAIGTCIANGIIMLIEMPPYGVATAIPQLFRSIITLGSETEGYAEALEIHELTFLFALFILYYIAFAPRDTAADRRKNVILASFSAFFVLTGIKRILLPAIPVFILFAIFVSKRKKPMAWVIGTGVFWVIFFGVYLYFVKHGAVSYVMDKLHINAMGRDYIWALVDKYYQLSPTFIGQGFEFVAGFAGRLVEEGLLDQAYPLHNDILKVFVELGFPGFCIWSISQYIVFPALLKKFFDAKTAVLYMSLLSLLTITYLTDNTAFYFWCMMGLRMIPLGYGIYRKRVFAPEDKKWQAPSKDDFQTLVNEKLLYQDKEEI